MLGKVVLTPFTGMLKEGTNTFPSTLLAPLLLAGKLEDPLSCNPPPEVVVVSVSV